MKSFSINHFDALINTQEAVSRSRTEIKTVCSKLSKTKSIVFIDSKVSDYESLIAGTKTDIEVVILDCNLDGVDQITKSLQASQYNSVHIVSHGSPGCLYLGKSPLCLSTLDTYANQLQQWFEKQESNELLLYGCNVAVGDAGEEFITRLYHLTKANIGASANRTGSAFLGADWNLEITVGAITPVLAFKPEVLESYSFAFPSANDDFANRIILSGVSGSSTGNNVGATAETGEATQSGTNNSIWWSWTAPSSGIVSFNTNTSKFDTYLYVYTGSSVSSLTLLKSDDDNGDGNASLVSFEAIAGTTYHIAVDGYNSATGDVTLNYAFSPNLTPGSNTAPTLTDTNVTLNTINEDASVPSGAVGNLISSLVSLGSNVTDPDNGAVTGVAITAANTSNGTWYYSINNGANWILLGAVSNSSARLLAADANTRIYFRPNSNFNGTISNAITFRAWDQRFGANGDSIDTSSNGSFTAFSSATDTASITVNAVNDTPVITANQTLDISNKTLTNGTVVGTVIATDADAGSILSNWAIVGGNTDRDGDGRQAFSINSTTGQIIINDGDELNPQTSPSINLQVNVSDGTVTSGTQVVTIKLVPNPPGSLDSSFGSGGKVTTSLGISASNAYATAIQADGKIIVVGEAYNGSSDFAIARYNPNGSLDTNFGNGGKVTTDLAGRTDRGYSVAIQSDGKIVVAGITYNASNTTDIAVVRYNPNGTLDTTFGNGGRVVTDFDGKSDWIHSIAIQSDGKIVVGGNTIVSNSPLNADSVLVRYNQNGTLDSNFGNGGRVVTSNSNGQDSISSITIQQDGRIVAAGNVMNSSGGFDFILARYNSNGSLDTSFGSSGKVTTDFSGKDDFGDSVLIQPDGKIVVAGSTGQVGVSGDFALARYNSNGTLDTTFGNNGRVVTGIGNGNDAGQSLAILPNGKIVVSGFSESPSGTTYNNRDFAVAVYNPDGTVDSSFGSGGKVITPVANSSSEGTSVAVQSDGKIVVAGSGNGDFTVIRYEAPFGSTSNTGNTGNTGNTAPSLIDTVVTLNSVNRDAALPSGTVGTLVSSFIGIGRNVTDSNTGAVTGIAITSADSTNGTWYYSTNNGTNWNTLGTVSSTSSRLLAADSNTRVYLRPNAGYTGSISNGITFRAWDQTSGVVGGVADTSVNGGSTAFSIATDTASITVNNPAPINDNFANQTILAGTSGNVTGTNVGATVETGEATQSGTNNSVWWSWTAPSSGTVTFDTIGSNFDTYLSVYTGTSVNSLTLVTFDDQSGGANTSRVSFAVTAGTTYRIAVDGYQASTGNISLNYSLNSGGTTTTGNLAPTLTDTVVTLNSVNEDAGAPSGALGTLVSSIVGLGRNVNDSRTGAVTGIAITSASISNGTWWYSTNNGANWLQMGTLSNSNARLLAADTNTRIYFQANANYNGSISNAITFRAWNQTSGVNGGTANTTQNGGSTAFSSFADTASITVNPVNDAPVISQSHPFGIPQNATTNGTIIGSLNATDIDSSTTVFSNWTIASGNIDVDGDGNMAFGINPNTGQIAINDIDDLNPQINPTVNLQVNVSDGLAISNNENVVIKLALKPGDLDPNFGTGGTVTTPLLGYARGVVVQPDGKIVVAGGFDSFDVARYNVDGSLDNSFGNGGRVNTDIEIGTESGYGVTLQSDGKIVVAGYVWNSAQPNYPDFALARYNANGSLDTSFGNGGKVITNYGEDFGRNILIQPDGKIILAGYIGNGSPDYVLVRYNANGSLDTSFGSSGRVNGTNGYVVALQSDGKILVGGGKNLARYNTNGSLDTSFGNAGRAIASIGFSYDTNTIAIQPDGKIVVAGNVWKFVNGTSSNQQDLAVARFNVDGSLDETFGYGGKIITPLSISTDDRATGITIQSNGKIIVSGYFNTDPNTLNRTSVLIALNPDGTLDRTFGTGGKVVTPLKSHYDENSTVATQADGKIVIVGKGDSSANFVVARYIGTSNDVSSIPTNTAPTLTDTTVTLNPVNNNAGVPTGIVGSLVSSIVSFSRNITDPNSGGLTGVAIIDANTTNGTWWYSTNNGTNWNALSQVSSTNARLLAADTFTRVYFQSNGISGSIANAITFRAWDQMGGTNGGIANTTINGGSTSFSSVIDTASITVNYVAPINDNFVNRIVLTGNTGTTTGTNVGAINEMGEPIQSGTTNSVWWTWTAPTSGTFTFDTIGSNFDTFLSVYTGTSVSNLINVASNNNFGGANTSQVSFAATGGTTYQIAVDGNQSSTGNITLNYSLNTAPTLTDTVVTLNSVNEDAYEPIGAVGTLVSSLVSVGKNVTDPNTGTATGIAITAVSSSLSLWYSINNGSSWNRLNTAPSNSQAFLLAADTNTRIHFRPYSNFNGTVNSAITFRAWDQTSGVAGNVADTTVNGGSTAFSTTTDTASIIVNSINDAPVITKGYRFSIPDNFQNGTVVGTMTAIDVDHASLSWTITSGNLDIDGDGNTAFHINASTGQIIINDSDDLNPQTNPSFDLQVNVSDGVTSDNEAVTIKLKRTTGDLDPSFGNGGIVTTNLGSSSETALSVAIQEDDKIVVLGITYVVNSPKYALTRYNPDGSLDTTFGNAGKLVTSIAPGYSNEECNVLVLQNGKILVSGTIRTGNDSEFVDFFLAQYNADGTSDNEFGNAGLVATAIGNSEDRGTSVAVQSDGKIIIAGHTRNVVGSNYRDFALARYNANGSLDNSFGNNGKVITDVGGVFDTAYSVAVQADGKIVVGGCIQDNGYDFGLVRYNSDGTLDTSFGNNGKVRTFTSVTEYGYTLAIQADGKIVLAGSVNGKFGLARYNSNGSLDANFGEGGMVSTDVGDNSGRIEKIIIQADGKILATGSTYVHNSNSSSYDIGVARYNADGSLDTSFGNAGKIITPISSTNDYAYSLALQSDSKIVVVGETNGDFAVVRYEGSVVNGVPTSTNKTVSLNEDTLYTFSSSNFSFTDIDNTDTLQQVKITQLPTQGQLFLDINNDNQATGEAITQNQIISVADFGKLKFKPVDNGNGANHSNFQFRVGDGKGFSNLAYTMTLDVAAINDAPTFLIGGNQIVNPGAGQQTVNKWASNFNPGAANESGQSIQNYIVEVINNSNIFKVAPTITQTGNLTYTPVDIMATSTIAQIRVSVQDNGGTANGGVDTSIPQIFTITVSGATTNMVNGGGVADAIVGTDKSDRIAGLAGNDTIYGGLGNDRIFGDAGNDTLYGDLLVLPAYGATFSMNDNIGGGSGDDLIYGQWGNDKLYGDDGNDRIWGGDGDDQIWGGLGNDVLNGGAGKDTFALVRSQGVDIIEDFKVGEDVLGCAGGLRFTSLSFIKQNGDTLIRDRVNNQDVAVLKGFTGSLNSNNFITL